MFSLLLFLTFFFKRWSSLLLHERVASERLDNFIVHGGDVSHQDFIVWGKDSSTKQIIVSYWWAQMKFEMDAAPTTMLVDRQGREQVGTKWSSEIVPAGPSLP